MRQFESAKAHQSYYAQEINSLYQSLNLNETETRASLAYLLGCETSVFENTAQIVGRLFPLSTDQCLISSYSVDNVKGSNVNNAIDMLEGKTENYFNVEYYKDIIDNANQQSLSLNQFSLLTSDSQNEYENKLRNVYQTSLNIFQNGKKSDIAYAQTSITTIYTNLMSSLTNSGVDYVGTLIPIITLKNISLVGEKVTATVENNSGNTISNKYLIFASHTSNDTLKQIKLMKITEIQNLYSETKEFEFDETVTNYKVFLWDQIGNLSPLSKL